MAQMTEQIDSSSTSEHKTCTTITGTGRAQSASVDQDGNEGDDERTSGQSAGETADAEAEIDDNGKEHESSEPVVREQPSDTTGWKPLPIRKKHRRGSKRNHNKPGKRYVPYSKLSWEEKRQRDERDTKRANKLREQYFNAKGRPTAPYNTTQYLMAEHDLAEPDLGSHVHMQSGSDHESAMRNRQLSNSCDDSDFDDDYNESPEDEIYEQKFFEKDFTEAYEQVHVENLHSMSKSELVREFMMLEERVENMEIRLKESEAIGNAYARTSSGEIPNVLNGEDHTLESRTKEEVLLIELNKLRKENERLRKENEDMKKSCLKCVAAKIS